jgi:hypothetical protein
LRRITAAAVPGIPSISSSLALLFDFLSLSSSLHSHAGRSLLVAITIVFTFPNIIFPTKTYRYLSAAINPMSHESASPQSLSPIMAGIQAPPTSPASPFADTVDTVEQAIRGAIQSMLLAGASCDDILFMVKTHRDSKEVGILADLDTMSAVPTEDLAERIHDIG